MVTMILAVLRRVASGIANPAIHKCFQFASYPLWSLEFHNTYTLDLWSLEFHNMYTPDY